MRLLILALVIVAMCGCTTISDRQQQLIVQSAADNRAHCAAAESCEDPVVRQQVLRAAEELDDGIAKSLGYRIDDTAAPILSTTAARVK